MSVDETRRKETRERIDGQAVVRVVSGPFEDLKDIKLEASVLDVSASGLRLDCSELLDQCFLEMKITLPSANDFVTLFGEVRWASWEEGGDYQLGIEFTRNDTPNIIKWSNMLKAL